MLLKIRYSLHGIAIPLIILRNPIYAKLLINSQNLYPNQLHYLTSPIILFNLCKNFCLQCIDFVGSMNMNIFHPLILITHYWSYAFRRVYWISAGFRIGLVWYYLWSGSITSMMATWQLVFDWVFNRLDSVLLSLTGIGMIGLFHLLKHYTVQRKLNLIILSMNYFVCSDKNKFLGVLNPKLNLNQILIANTNCWF